MIGAAWRSLRGRKSRRESLELQIPVNMCHPSVSRASQVCSAAQSWLFCRLARRRAGVAQSEASLLELGAARLGLEGLPSHVDAGDRVEQAPDTSRRSKWAVGEWIQQ